MAEVLARLVEDGTLTEAEAVDILENYEELPEGWFPDSPESTATGTRDVETYITLLLLIGLYAVLRRRIAEENASQALRALSQRARERLITDLQTRMEGDLTQLARAFASSDISLVTWQRAFNDVIRSYHHAVARATAGAVNLPANVQNLVNRIVSEQQAFLTRFADAAAASAARGNPMSVGYLERRSLMYSGSVRGLGYRVLELASAPGSDIVVDYISRDDDRTCSECLDAQNNGPYLLGQGPMPGEVCLGRDKCRCIRVQRQDAGAAAAIRRGS